MLNLKLQVASVVVLSQGNNPSLLNPDFLERNAIVPKEWKPIQTIVTPPLATVQYDNGVSVVAEERKLSFSASGVSVGTREWAAMLARAARSYLEVLHHVSYTAVGLNFVHSSSSPQGQAAEEMLISCFLKEGEWQRHAGGMTGANLEFQFRRAYPHLTLKVAVRETVQAGGKELDGFGFIGNYHHDFAPEDLQQRAQFIESIETRETDLHALFNKLPLR
jgi:hypothetical protein